MTTLSIEPVLRQSVSDAAFEQLSSQILCGDLEAGAALPSERSLCQSFGINRGALREALSRLEQARLVSIQQGGRTRVCDFPKTACLDLLPSLLFSQKNGLNSEVARSIIEMRAVIVPDIARLAAKRITPEQSAHLIRLVADMRSNVLTPAEQHKLTQQFWDQLTDASANIAYRLAHNSLVASYEKFAEALTKALLPEITAIYEFEALQKAIVNGDSKQAYLLASQLVEHGTQALLKVLATLAQHTNKKREGDTNAPPST